MVEFAIIGLIVAIIVGAVIARWSRTAQPIHLRRLHAGVNNKAEWMAPDDVVRAVETDYLDTQCWMADALLAGYIRFVREAPQHFTGSYLKQQLHIADQQLRGRGPRFIGVLRAHHYIRVRYFSDDGQTCYLVDLQTERRMATYDYWHLRRLHTQDLWEGAYVYRMVYDRAARRWKIEELIQQLPLGWGQNAIRNNAIRLEKSLPIASGRDT